ncbi:MAG TPA: hypothetical protein P5077_09085 [bacterium]|nr:hypothetical protein [bacterium]
MRKAVLFIGLFLSLAPFFCPAEEPAPLTRRMEALAIGEASLAYRLISLSVSLAIANATDAGAITGLLDNVDNTLHNGKTFLTAQNAGGPLTGEISGLFDSLLSCSAQVKEYAKNKNYDRLQKVRTCTETIEGSLSALTKKFNRKEPASPTVTPAKKSDN